MGTGGKSRRARVVVGGARLGVALGILGAVGLGVSTLYARSSNVTAAVAAPPPVLAMRVERSPGHAETRRFAGRLEPARTTELGFERGGLLTESLSPRETALRPVRWWPASMWHSSPTSGRGSQRFATSRRPGSTSPG